MNLIQITVKETRNVSLKAFYFLPSSVIKEMKYESEYKKHNVKACL